MHQSSCCSWGFAVTNGLNFFFFSAEHFTQKASGPDLIWTAPDAFVRPTCCVEWWHLVRLYICLASLLRANLVNQISSILVVWIWLQPSGYQMLQPHHFNPIRYFFMCWRQHVFCEVTVTLTSDLWDRNSNRCIFESWWWGFFVPNLRRNSLKVFLRYWIHENGTNRQTTWKT